MRAGASVRLAAVAVLVLGSAVAREAAAYTWTTTLNYGGELTGYAETKREATDPTWSMWCVETDPWTGQCVWFNTFLPSLDVSARR